MTAYLCVALGGFLGSICRFYIANRLHKHPVGTWIANVSGSLLLVIVYRLFSMGQITETLWLLIGIGFCGAYTTFSTFGNETLKFILAQQYWEAILYVIGSFTISVGVILIVLSL